MVSHCHTIALTCGNSATFREVGALGKKHLSTGVGWLGSVSHPLPFHTFVVLLNIFGTRHRILAELLDQGTRSTLTIPSHHPPPPPSTGPPNAAALANGAQASRGVLEMETIRSLGLNPSHALQHPGFYYYMAARCTEKRRERFLSMEADVSLLSSCHLAFSRRLKINF
jgi:hypothetical protein